MFDDMDWMKRFLNWLVGCWYRRGDAYDPPLWLVNLYLRQYHTKEELEELQFDFREIVDELIESMD